MSFESINTAMLEIYDELKDNKDAEDIIEGIDKAQSDMQLRMHVKRALVLIAKNNKDLADSIKEKLQGWLL